MLTAKEQPWYKRVFTQKKIWIPLAVLLVLIIIAAVPWTRYKLLGLVIKQTYKVHIVDSQTNLPVSDATVTLDGKTATTDNKGQASIKVPVGDQNLTIGKKYYKTLSRTVLVGLKSKPATSIQLQATGRQVPLKVVNLISGAPVSNIEVSAAGTSAKTDTNGQVTMVLPADKTSTSASLSGNGYNDSAATIKITAATDPANTFKMVPSGKVYFLSNASGKIDVVSTNLDGSNRQTVLAGTGKEDANGTELLPSNDQKYLALMTARSGSRPGLYVISTSNNQLSTVNTDNANFNVLGWTSDDHLVYQATSNTIDQTQNGYQQLKSYSTSGGQQLTLDQTTAQDLGSGLFAYQDFESPTLLANGTLVYTTLWNSTQPLPPQGAPQQGFINAIQASTGKYKQNLQALTPFIYYYAENRIDGPNTVYVTLNGAGSSPMYEYNSGTLKQVTSLPSDLNDFQSTTFYSSPSGNATAWAKAVDGQSAIYTGDSTAANAKQLALLDSSYRLDGWLGDNYLLLSKSNNQLYLMPAAGLTGSNKPVKITDYLQTYGGY